MNKALDESYRACEQIARASGSNFYRSFSLLRPDKRRSMSALYAFARIVDDWGDAPSLFLDSSDRNEVDHATSNADPSRSSMAWKGWIDGCIDMDMQTFVPDRNATAPSSVMDTKSRQKLKAIRLAIADTVHRYQMPRRYLYEIVEGVTYDWHGLVRIADNQELDRYCYLVASSVGLACISIWGGDIEKTQCAGIDCGIAFQLTNIVRDIAEDASRGRIYLPTESMVQHGCSAEAWLKGIPDGDWQEVIREQIERAKMKYRSGWDVYDQLQTDGQRMFSMIWRTYHQLLKTVENSFDRIWKQRIRLTKTEKLGLYLQHAILPWYRSLPAPFHESPVSKESQVSKGD